MAVGKSQPGGNAGKSSTDADASSSDDVMHYYRTIREDDPEVGDQVRDILRSLAARVATRKAGERILSAKREVGEA